MALGDLHSRLESPIVATYPIHSYYNTHPGGVLVLKKICAKKFTISGYPNPVQFHGSLNLSSSDRCGVDIHLMHSPIRIPISNAVIICVYMLRMLGLVVL